MAAIPLDLSVVLVDQDRCVLESGATKPWGGLKAIEGDMQNAWPW